MRAAGTTPVIIGVGQSVDRIDAPDYQAWSAADLAAVAARAAISDAMARRDLAPYIDAIVTTRTFEDSGLEQPIFGASDNFPRSIAARLGIKPRSAFWGEGGGQSPQDLVSEFCERVAAGEFDLVLLCGAEAISTIRHAAREGRTLDFSESPGGEVEDRGANLRAFQDPLAERHGVVDAPIGYALAENARRAALGMTQADYAEHMGRLFAPLAAVARTNSAAAWDVPNYSASDLITVSPGNRWIADPYPLRLVARDQVNMGAAVVIASQRVADDLGVAPDRRVYLHGYARATEKPLLSRPDLSASPAARAAARAALKRAGLVPDAVATFDFYSCFPIAVSNVAIDEFGLSEDDPRKLSVVGGLPYFGGPGNNYSMHAIAALVPVLREAPGKAGFVGANGGFLSKYSAGVYSTIPRPWRNWSSTSLQAELDAVPAQPLLDGYDGPGTVETASVLHVRGAPEMAVVIGRTPGGLRFIARSKPGDAATIAMTHENDVLGWPVTVARSEEGLNLFVFGDG
ncbi:acetyl-CoA acetyltransferase [Sphingobium fluviale]|uniref:Acetyl-CoA acetyltransferase n=1 Tax=Sphingobium fluviale TaxID=2506423 RepID=A0A4Q1KJJ2_9SPHN|nr:acetyl-CoA acetyltransferase [Sphingobium fluviale]RXR29520.1 acetyl-CoA acetyltransferase [Sphingobium fluviale]